MQMQFVHCTTITTSLRLRMLRLRDFSQNCFLLRATIVKEAFPYSLSDILQYGRALRAPGPHAYVESPKEKRADIPPPGTDQASVTTKMTMSPTQCK